MKWILAAAAMLTLTSCGGIRYYVHQDEAVQQATRSAVELETVELRVGQQLKLLKHSQGIAIIGGYKQGVVVEDTNVVGVQYGDGTDDFAAEVYLIGKKVGVTMAGYGNRLGAGLNYTTSSPRFRVIVR